MDKGCEGDTGPGMGHSVNVLVAPLNSAQLLGSLQLQNTDLMTQGLLLVLNTYLNPT